MTTLSFGSIGRCRCGGIGKRRSEFSGEPICGPCVRQRKGHLRVIDPLASARVEGTLTPAQRRARRAWMRDLKQVTAFRANDEVMHGYEERVDSDGDGRHM